MNKKLKKICKKGLKHQPDYGKKSRFTKDQFVADQNNWWQLVHKAVKDFEKSGRMYIIYNIGDCTYLYRQGKKHVHAIAFTARGIMGLTNAHDHILMDIDAYWTMIRLFDAQHKAQRKSQADLMKKTKKKGKKR